MSHRSVFFDEDVITSNSFLEMLEKYALPQLINNNNLIVQLDGASVHIAHIVCGSLNVNFPGRWIGRGGANVWPPRSPDLTHLDFSLWGYVKDQAYSQRENTLDEIKPNITAAISNVTAQLTKRRTIGEMCAELLMALVVNFPTCA
jgi:hypothetical protein